MGFYKKWTPEYEYIASIQFYLSMLKLTAYVSYIIQTHFSLVTDTLKELKVMKENLEGLREDEVVLPLQLHLKDNDKF